MIIGFWIRLEGIRKTVIRGVAAWLLLIAWQQPAPTAQAEEVSGSAAPAVVESSSSQVDGNPSEGKAAQTDPPPTTQSYSDTTETPTTKPTEDPLESFIQKTKKPVDGWKWGMDLRLREVNINNAITLDKRNPNHEIHWQRQRLRLWNTITPVEDVEFNFRLVWEGKHFDRPISFENWQPTSAGFDELNLKLTRIGGSPFTIQAGRQDVMLGDRWLVMDGTPLDGSSTLYFDAIRLCTELDAIDTTLDLIYLETDAEGDNWIAPIYDHNVSLVERDETGVIAWLTNQSIPDTQLDGYFIYKGIRAADSTDHDNEIYTFGARVKHMFTEQLSWRSNIAGQFGHKDDCKICALGSLNRLEYQWEDAWKNSLRLDYEYLSGDDPDTKTNEAFDILWGRWPRFSELYIYTNIGETGRIGDMTNLHRIGFGWTGQPSEKMTLMADYHLLFADQNTYRDRVGFSQNGCFRGQLLTAWLKYRLTSYLSGHLVGEVLFPGNYYSDDRNDVASFARAELVFSW